MANSAQARKRARQTVKQRAHNASLRSTLRTAIKRVQKAVIDGDKTAAQSIYQQSVSIIDSIADKKIIHKNKAARHKSRLSAHIKGMAAAAWHLRIIFRNQNGASCAVFVMLFSSKHWKSNNFSQNLFPIWLYLLILR